VSKRRSKPTVDGTGTVKRADLARSRQTFAARHGPAIDSGPAGATKAGAATVAPGAVLCAATGYGKAKASAAMTDER